MEQTKEQQDMIYKHHGAGWTCPICERTVTDFPAVSRFKRDLLICSKCGTTEAIDDWNNNHPTEKISKDEILGAMEQLWKEKRA